MFARMILPLILGMLVLSACQQDPLITEGEGQASADEADISLREKAEQGQASAQILIGTMYWAGEGVSQDYQEAVRWYQAAADQGAAEAQVILGAMYRLGEGVPRDYKEAVRWYQLAADQGQALVRRLLGLGRLRGVVGRAQRALHRVDQLGQIERPGQLFDASVLGPALPGVQLVAPPHPAPRPPASAPADVRSLPPPSPLR